MTQKKILFLTTQLPFPPKSGGTVKSYHYLKFLALNYDVTIASLLKEDDELHVDSFKKEFSLREVVTQKISVGRNPLNLLKSYITAPCLNAFRNYSTEFENKIHTLFTKNDVVIVDHYEVFQYIPKNHSGKVVMHTHNAEFMLWQRMSELTNNPIKKAILKLEATRVKKYESEIFNQSDLIYSTPSDIDLYKNHGFNISKHKITYHLGNDEMLGLPNLEFEETEKAVTFIGTLSWEPNIDGICWFIDNCWKQLKNKHPDLTLYILGKNPNSRILKSAKKDPNIVFTGFVKELDTYLQKTRVYIAPLRFGSGMKVKVLEGLYRGNPCVTTSVGAEGLDLEDGENSYISDTPEAFIASCLHLLQNKEKWELIRDKVRKLAAEKYTWQALFVRMEKSLQEIL